MRDRIAKGQLVLEPGLVGLQLAGDGAVVRATIPEVSLVPAAEPRLGAYLTAQDLDWLTYRAPHVKSLLAAVA